MKLTALRLHNVKRFGGHGVAIEGIGDGVNVMTAANEFGKSTAFEALHALFFQPHTSTGKAVQALRPYSGGNPLVEVDIATVDGLYRLTKQFYGGKRAEVHDLATGRLIRQADEAEAFIHALTRGGSAGPAGLLWVRQGVTGIEQRSNKEEEGEKRVRETLLSSVQGEVEALTGGRRMADILGACEAELFALVTATRQPKKQGPYFSAIDARDRLVLEESRLKGEVSALREALDRRRATLSALAELEDPAKVADRRRAILAAQAAHDTARSHGEALKLAEAEAALARQHQETALKALTEYRMALETARQLAVRTSEATARYEAAFKAHRVLSDESDATQLEIAAAEANEREQRDLLARLDAALRARDAAERLTELRVQLEKAEAAREHVEASEAALATLRLPASQMAQLETIELDLVRLRAAQEATLPTVRIDYQSGAAETIRMAGEQIASGQEIGVASILRLDIEGVGTLTMRSNRPPEADQGIDRAIATRTALLESLGVDSVAAARQRQAQAREKTGELDLARQRLADLAPEGMTRLQQLVARLEAESGGDLELKGDTEAVRAAHVKAEQQIATTRNAARERQPVLVRASGVLTEIKADLAGLAAQIAALEDMLGPMAGRAERQSGLSELLNQRQGAHAAAEARAAALRPMAQDVAAAEATLKRLQSVEAASVQRERQLRETLAELNGAITSRADGAIEETWRETIEKLGAAQAVVKRFQTEIAVLERLLASLAAARSAARDLYLKPVMTELRPLVGLLFDDISVVFDEDTLLPQTVTRNGQDEDVDRLSGGMREQLSVLTRLAFARLLARDGKSAPVILDDALVYSDDDRIERMFDALHQQARDQQILVFSCRQRAFSQLGGNILQMQAWAPAPR